jgi:hypothetical protein
LQLDGLLYQKNFIDEEAIKTFLDSLWFPLCFLDFETTYMVPIPLFDGMKPYEQLPFQFSLHVIEKEGVGPVHHANLAKDFKNPCKEFLSNLLAVMPSGACILTWNKTFEAERLKGPAARFPENTAEINAIVEHIRDLMVPFRDKSIYHSFSAVSQQHHGECHRDTFFEPSSFRLDWIMRNTRLNNKASSRDFRSMALLSNMRGRLPS